MAGRAWRPTATLGLAVASSRPFSTHQLAPGEKHLPRCLCSGSCQEHLRATLGRDKSYSRLPTETRGTAGSREVEEGA